MKIVLDRHQEVAGGWVTGHIICGDELLDVASAVKLLQSCPDVATICKIVREWQGFYSLVVHYHGAVLIVSDRVNSTPVFFGAEEIVDTFSSDEVDALRTYCDEESLRLRLFYELSGVMPGRSTFRRGMSSSAAGCIYLVSHKGNARHVYSEFFARNHCENRAKEIRADWDDRYSRVVEVVSNNIRRVCAGRQVLVPLSGGFDSRLVVEMLARSGVGDVLCFTYGNPHDPEQLISRGVADSYGYRWECVPYTRKMWQELPDDPVYRRFARTFASGFSVIHFQDFMAIRGLVARGLCRPGTVVLPGHAMDFLAGNHIPDFCFDELTPAVRVEELVSYALHRHFSLRFRNQRETREVDDWIRSRLAELRERPLKEGELSRTEAGALYMRLNFYERQTKFILNSLRIYDYFGLSWYMPLWENAFIEFYESLHFDLLKNRFVSVNWDFKHIKQKLSPDTQSRAYAQELQKPTKSGAFLKGRSLLVELRVYRLLMVFVLIKKVFWKNEYGWFWIVPMVHKVRGCVRGYKEVYAYFANGVVKNSP